MTVCFPQFILPKFLFILTFFIIIHLIFLLIAKKKKFFKDPKHFLIINVGIFIVYIIISYILGHGINEFGVVNCIGD